MGRNLKILIFGNGAREHAISKAYERSEDVSRLIVAPGNDLIKHERNIEVICDSDCFLKNPESLLRIAQKYKPDIVDVASDNALGSGVVDLLESNGFIVFGPNRDAARLEYDKIFAKNFMRNSLIASAPFRDFNSVIEGIQYARSIYTLDPKKFVFVKAAGLCEGKGALDSLDLEVAILNIHRMKEFGESGIRFIIEDGLEGDELSAFVVVSGDSWKVVSNAVDYKRLNDDNNGPQTGGMGSFSPVNLSMTSERSINSILERTLRGLDDIDVHYRGILYLGLIKTFDGLPGLSLIEYNARWGDPEAQVILPGILNYTGIVDACLSRRLGSVEIRKDDRFRVCVVGAAKGYPNDPRNVYGKEIFGLEEVMKFDDIEVYGSGVKIIGNRFYASGGRLFSIVGEGENLTDAKDRVYDAMARVKIDGDNLHFRTTIGDSNQII